MRYLLAAVVVLLVIQGILAWVWVSSVRRGPLAGELDVGRGWRINAPLYLFDPQGNRVASGGIPDDLLVFGNNIEITPAGETRPDPTRHGYWLALEEDYQGLVEFNLNLQPLDGVNRRYMQAEIPQNGSGGAWMFRGRLFAVEGYTGTNRMFSVREDERAVRIHINPVPSTLAAESYALELQGRTVEGDIFLNAIKVNSQGGWDFYNADGQRVFAIDKAGKIWSASP
ncbi:MAG: hypothetical protein HYU29_06960 [Chloroflexi bacterium]|nr:hypothetical protein [Chloroflexota bacterium]